jgi:hypothetical protein
MRLPFVSFLVVSFKVCVFEIDFDVSLALLME